MRRTFQNSSACSVVYLVRTPRARNTNIHNHVYYNSCSSSSASLLRIQEATNSIPWSLQTREAKEDRSGYYEHWRWRRRGNFVDPSVVGSFGRRGTFDNRGACDEFWSRSPPLMILASTMCLGEVQTSRAEPPAELSPCGRATAEPSASWGGATPLETASS